MNFEIAFALLRQVRYSEKYFNHAYLQLFQVIEDFAKLQSVFTGSDNFYVVEGGNDILVRKLVGTGTVDALIFGTNGKYNIGEQRHNLGHRHRPDINFTVSALIIFRLGQASSSYLKWTEVYSTRNSGAAHFNETDIINQGDILKILQFISGFIDERSKNIANHGKGLQEEPMENRLAALQEKFGSAIKKKK